MQNVQMLQSPVGAPQPVSPMTHPPQMSMGTIQAVSSMTVAAERFAIVALCSFAFLLNLYLTITLLFKVIKYYLIPTIFLILSIRLI